MSIDFTVRLPEEIARRAEFLAQESGQPVTDVLASVIQASLQPLGPIEEDSPIETWPDEDVLAAADMLMDVEQSRELSDLLAKQREGLLAPAERRRLDALMELYQRGQLRKARGLVEAVRRGLRERLKS